MSYGTWYCKEDVLRDLGAAGDIDEGFFAVGDRPPPRPAYVEDDTEIQLMFGNTSRVATLDNQNDGASDFKGITKMIRMVQNYENTEEDEEPEIPLKSQQNNVVVISKLNPNVKEFVPKGFMSQRHNPEQDNIKTFQETKSLSENLNKTASINCSNSSNLKTISQNTINENGTKQLIKEDKNKLNELNPSIAKTESVISETSGNTSSFKSIKNNDTEFQKMADSLKQQVSDASKEYSFEKSKEKNTALAKLLSLYTGAPPKPTSKPKLYTPQFFEQCKATDYKNDNETDTSFKTENVNSKPISNVNILPSEVTVDNKRRGSYKITLLTPDNINKCIFEENLVPNEISQEQCKEISTAVDTDDNDTTQLTPDLLKTTIDGDDDPALESPSDSQLKDSIKKVNNWFENKPAVKPKPKSPTVYLGAVAFKRKDTATCKSPSEMVDNKVSKPSDGVFKPSKHAEELLKKYKEQAYKKTTHNMNVFDKLYHDLKEKDAEIRDHSKKVARNQNDA